MGVERRPVVPAVARLRRFDVGLLGRAAGIEAETDGVPEIEGKPEVLQGKVDHESRAEVALEDLGGIGGSHVPRPCHGAEHDLARKLDLKPGDRVIVAPAVSTADARERFANVDEVKPYLRFADAPA